MKKYYFASLNSVLFLLASVMRFKMQMWRHVLRFVGRCAGGEGLGGSIHTREGCTAWKLANHAL